MTETRKSSFSGAFFLGDRRTRCKRCGRLVREGTPMVSAELDKIEEASCCSLSAKTNGHEDGGNGSTDACSNSNSNNNSISAVAAEPCSADRKEGGPLGSTSLPGGRSSTPIESLDPPSLHVGAPQLEEGGPSDFEPASCFKPACQGPECPLACCSPESACLADLLHAGDATSPHEFLCHSSSTSSAHVLSQQQQQQRLQRPQGLPQQAHFHPDRGPPATALPPGKGAAGSSARHRGSRSRSPTPSSPSTQGSPRAEQQPVQPAASAAVGAAVVAAAPAAEVEDVVSSSQEETGGLHLPPAAALTAANSEGESNAVPEAPAGLFKLRKRDGVSNLADLAKEEGDGFLHAAGESAAAVGSERAGSSSPEASSAGSLSAEIMRALRPSRIGADSRLLACTQQERQKQSFKAQEEAEPREEAPAIRVPWFSDFCFPPKEEEPWEMTYEAFVKWRVNLRKREAADVGLHATRRGAEQQGGGGEAAAAAASAGPVTAAAAAALGANSGRGLGRLLSSSTVEEPPPECGAHWSRALNGARPVVLPRGSDLVTYVEIENGRRKEQHALYSREHGGFEQGNRNFRDMFDFIRWVHAEGGAAFPWDSLSPASHEVRAKTAHKTPETESGNNEEIDDAFDPDSPPGNAVVPEADFPHVADSPWKESAEESDGNLDSTFGGGGEAARTPEDAVNGWPVVGATASAQVPAEEPPWLHSPADGVS
ncbi:hypothetical protein Emag_000077 [Eimeria magna]